MIKPLPIRSLLLKLIIFVVILVTGSVQVNAQHNEVKLKISDNWMRIWLPRDINQWDLDSFIARYKLEQLGLNSLVQLGKTDSLLQAGWTINNKDAGYFKLEKELTTSDEESPYPGNVIFTPVPTPDNWREVGGNKTVCGSNKFVNHQEFKIENNIVYFHLSNFEHAKKVKLAGNFTNWQHGAFPMKKETNGWSVPVQLSPGIYYYKFIVDDEWMTDPANKLSENDGRGNENSVFFVPNQHFELKKYPEAKTVFLTGNFVNWSPRSLPMHRIAEGWRIDMFLEAGTWNYQYLIDKEKPFPDTPLVISIGNPWRFQLDGFKDAKKVYLAGNFNDWKEKELLLTRTGSGWGMDYVLGPGNYQYKYIVDGRWITDPANPLSVDDGKGNTNSFLVIEANYTFRLKGYEHAQYVSLSGDFINWSSKGLPMKREGKEWVRALYLAQGKHVYKFIVDGKPVLDPSNKAWEGSNPQSGASVLWVEIPVKDSPH